ncbi:Bromodomain associated domain [Dillenia turbinata]|uniref:Bromodomain associated domain n=1 Tax=Dillenia turbinata TaxID=194707 RepID=A0AAN8UXL8_9MAGN
MALLGDDGRGYELARKLENCGVWRSWLGESNYANFIHTLSSPSTWEAFMRSDDSKSKFLLQLQLRVRSLLFDKALISLHLRPSSAVPTSALVSKLNPTYLQLHGDDVYYTLEDWSQDVVRPSSNSASRSKVKLTSGFGSRYGEPEVENVSHRFRPEELPETWYGQFIEKYRATRPFKLPFGDRDSDKRTADEMSSYLKVLEKHKRRRVPFRDDHIGFSNSIMENGHGNSVLEGNKSVDDEIYFFPEAYFALNCVPDSALPSVRRVANDQKVEFHGVLDTLPQVVTRSPIMIERLGIRPDLMDQGAQLRGKSGAEVNKRRISEEQALKVSQKVIARMLATMGFEGATEIPLEVLSKLLSCHISKLGRMLRVLADSYRKQCSAIELLKMFLQTAGYSNLGALAEHVKDGTRNFVHQSQQQVQGIPSQLQAQQNAHRLLQQTAAARQMHPQMQHMVVPPQNLALQQQQQWERMRRRQQLAPRPVLNVDKDRPMVEVKLEHPSELPLENNAFTTINARHPQLQFQQQSLATVQNLHAQTNNQFRQMSSLQLPQTPNVGFVRTPPVKVEGFQELMGGDTSKHDSEESRLTSPSK